ncbi:Oligopeptide transport system permease protein OppC (TC 3.A.1.5.1) [Microbacterium esteraromaticum]|uniref:Oligopeptide transport system permease protein OppC (TC 3.A.1.5.1) n=1 Tax=Microbacterium esteraromaticum TaxID=57043 RepID=A0A1R4IJY8_9MICO|nr:Oligopeptide transport system permease protein OppC (TC 3.A.1.5.1) [Microbacterium esteraromaticum]
MPAIPDSYDEMPTPKTSALAAVAPRKKHWSEKVPVLSQLRQSIGLQRGMLVTGLVITAVFILVAVLAPLIAPYSWAQQQTADGVSFGTQQAPNSLNLLGTTVSGFDVLSRVIWGAQTALLVIIAAIACSIFIGIALGLVSGYFGGWLDRILVVIADAIYAFPSLLLAIVMSIVISRGQSTLFGGIMATAIAITVVFVPQYFRVVRSEVVRVRAEPFVDSAKVIGVPTSRILLRHVLRNSTRSLPVIITLNASEALLTLAGLGFLGFGIEATAAAEWGYDLNRAMQDVTSGIWWTSVFPGVAIVLVVLGVTLVGESLNDLSDPRLRMRRRAGAKKAGAKKKVSNASEGAQS